MVLRSNNTAAKYLTKALLVGDGKRQPRVNCGLCFSLPDCRSAVMFQSDWNTETAGEKREPFRSCPKAVAQRQTDGGVSSSVTCHDRTGKSKCKP